jgi:hypothetical protein
MLLFFNLIYADIVRLYLSEANVKIFKNVKNVQKCQKCSKNVQKMFKNVQKCSKMFKKYQQMSKNLKKRFLNFGPCSFDRRAAVFWNLNWFLGRWGTYKQGDQMRSPKICPKCSPT